MKRSEESSLQGHDPHAVIAAIQARHGRRQRGDLSADGRKLALVLEGGALRAAASAGGAVVLAQLGFSDLFDDVYATSAAVMNAAYFISNQPLLGISVYFDNCTRREFLNPWRFWKIIDVDYIFDHVAVHDKPLDTDRVLASPTRMHVAVMDRRSGSARMLNVKTAGVPLLSVLKAAAAIPVFYNRAVELGGVECMDGGLVMPFGLRQAIADGCTDVLVLSTLPANHLSQPPGRFSRMVFDALCARGNGALSRAFADKHLRASEERELALGRIAAPAHVRIATICPHPEEELAWMTTDRRKLHAAAVEYGRRTLRLFGRSSDAWTLPEECATAEDRGLLLE